MFAALKQKLFGAGDKSKLLAKSRLHFVLVQDRTGLTSEEMSQFKRELYGVIQRFFEIDEKRFDVSYKREAETTTLLINSPLVVKRHGKGESPQKEQGKNGKQNGKHDKKGGREGDSAEKPAAQNS